RVPGAGLALRLRTGNSIHRLADREDHALVSAHLVRSRSVPREAVACLGRGRRGAVRRGPALPRRPRWPERERVGPASRELVLRVGERRPRARRQRDALPHRGLWVPLPRADAAILLRGLGSLALPHVETG